MPPPNDYHLFAEIKTPSRDLASARRAYAGRDAEASRAAHTSNGQHAERHGSAPADALKPVVFGGLDGIVTIFAIVAGCVGARLSVGKTFVVGLGNLLADAVAMGVGEYVSGRAEDEYMEAEKKRELWEMENFPEGEIQEMEEIYVNRYGFSEEDAREIVALTSKYPSFFLSNMMVEELGLLSHEEAISYVTKGFIMFFSFLLFGSVPLTVFSTWEFVARAVGFTTTVEASFAVACFASALTLFTLGAVKASFVSQSRCRSGLLMMSNGIVAGGLAYGVGTLLKVG